MKKLNIKTFSYNRIICSSADSSLIYNFKFTPNNSISVNLKQLYYYFFTTDIPSSFNFIADIINDIFQFHVLPKTISSTDNTFFIKKNNFIIFNNKEESLIDFSKANNKVDGTIKIYNNTFEEYKKFIKYPLTDTEQYSFILELEKMFLFDYIIKNHTRGSNNILIGYKNKKLSILSLSHKISRYYNIDFYSKHTQFLLDRPFSEETVKKYKKVVENKRIWKEIELRIIKNTNYKDKKIMIKYLEKLKSRLYNISVCFNENKNIKELLKLPKMEIKYLKCGDEVLERFYCKPK
ncbi:hypothetical protein SLOPH_683 [Spraguea lophii 42_110]|uniref:Uncharacterized protein n=1 Tax=Spraguea lophii (strain 42_110) TaxID=1358809 RepID=S7XPD1_SPRLO|nr:hypothetical protein SLOPH_683 [Spraguea lophii 42_110]